MLHGTGKETFDAVKMLKAADPARYTPAPGAKLSEEDAWATACASLLN